MSKLKSQEATSTPVVKVRGPQTKRRSIVKFGSLTIRGVSPLKEVVDANVVRGQQALSRALHALVTPGVKLREKKNVPQYWVSEDLEDVFIRRLNGRTDYGKLVDGRFKVLD